MRRNRYLLVFLLVFFCLPRANTQTVEFAGRIRNADTGDAVEHAILRVRETGQQTQSDERGFFSFLRLPPGRYTLSVRHVAFSAVERIVTVPPFGSDSSLITMVPAVHSSGEIVVLAARSASAMERSPYPLHAALQDELSLSSGVTLADVLHSVPGMALVRDGVWETTFSIRGMSRSNIVTLVDNARIETATDIAGAQSLINIHDLERVELLKSAGSVLHGTGALGGVVQFVTKRPSFTDHPHFSMEWSGDVSSVNRGYSQYVAVESAGDRAALRVSGGYRRAGNTETPYGAILNSQFHDFTLNGALAVATLAGQSALFTYQRAQAEDTGIPGGAPIAASASATYRLARRELYAVDYEMPNLTPALPLLSLRASRQKIERNVDIFQNPFVTVTPHAVHTTTSAQIEARVTPAPQDLLTVGVEGWERELDSRRERIDTKQNLITGERPLPASRYRSLGLFAHNEWELVPEDFTVMCGARYDWISVTHDEVWNPEYVLPPGGVPTVPQNQRRLWTGGVAHDASWSLSAGLRFAVSGMLDLTALGATAFRSPSLEERFEFIDLGSFVRVGDPNLKPEKSVTIDLGARLHAPGCAVRVDVFLNRLTNRVTDVSGAYDGRPAILKQNIGEARVYGWELEGDQTLTDRLAGRLCFAYVRGEDTRNHVALPQIAPLSGLLEFRGDAWSAGTVAIGTSFAARQANPGEGETDTPGHAAVDLSYASPPLGFGGVSVTLRCAVQNVFDSAYRLHLSTMRTPGTVEPGRNVVLSATVLL